MILPSSHGVVSVEHLFAQLAVLDPPRELNVSELVSQELRPQEALEGHTEVGQVAELKAFHSALIRLRSFSKISEAICTH